MTNQTITTASLIKNLDELISHLDHLKAKVANSYTVEFAGNSSLHCTNEIGPKASAALAEHKATNQLLDKVGHDTLADYIQELIADGVTYFEDIFDAVREEVGDYRLEQRVSDVLSENKGTRWCAVKGPRGGPNYHLLNS